MRDSLLVRSKQSPFIYQHKHPQGAGLNVCMLGKTDCTSRKDDSVLKRDASYIQLLCLPNCPAPYYWGSSSLECDFLVLVDIFSQVLSDILS